MKCKKALILNDDYISERQDFVQRILKFDELRKSPLQILNVMVK